MFREGQAVFSLIIAPVIIYKMPCPVIRKWKSLVLLYILLEILQFYTIYFISPCQVSRFQGLAYCLINSLD